MIPPNMKYHGIEVTSDEIAEVFAGFFDKKVVGIVESTSVDPGVYNGRQKIIATDEMFMTGDKILESIKGLKLKNTEGYDRIPQRIIPLRAKRVGEFIEIRHKKISPTSILSTLGCL